MPHHWLGGGTLCDPGVAADTQDEINNKEAVEKEGNEDTVDGIEEANTNSKQRMMFLIEEFKESEI